MNEAPPGSVDGMANSSGVSSFLIVPDKKRAEPEGLETLASRTAAARTAST